MAEPWFVTDVTTAKPQKVKLTSAEPEHQRKGHHKSDQYWNHFRLGKLLRDGVARIWAFPST